LVPERIEPEDLSGALPVPGPKLIPPDQPKWDEGTLFILFLKLKSDLFLIKMMKELFNFWI
jgi:hypothetical protein